MNTKLTLSVDREIIERAKIFAKKSNRSLSEIIETYLDRISTPETMSDSSDLKDLIGIISLPTDFDEKAAIRDLRAEKYL